MRTQTRWVCDKLRPSRGGRVGISAPGLQSGVGLAGWASRHRHLVDSPGRRGGRVGGTEGPRAGQSTTSVDSPREWRVVTGTGQLRAPLGAGA